ncbi:MAG: hypothetical protein V4463_10100 [Pseudomonadota bacterium]
MKKVIVTLLMALLRVSGTAQAEETGDVSSYGQAVLAALSVQTQAPPGDIARQTAPFSGTVKLTVKLSEHRIVTVEPTVHTANGMWHQGINEIAWSTALPEAPVNLAQRYHSIQYSALVTLDASHRYSFSAIKPLNGLAFVRFD